MWAFASGCFQYPGAQTLPAHFHQAKPGNAANLNACTVVLERFFHRLFDFADIGIVFHVDEVDHNQTRHIAQAQLPCNFTRCFEVCVERGLLNPVFFSRTPGVDINRHQGLSRVDDQIAARF